MQAAMLLVNKQPECEQGDQVLEGKIKYTATELGALTTRTSDEKKVLALFCGTKSLVVGIQLLKLFFF